MSKRPLAPHVGERIGRYELVEEIGRGGFGVVYRARQAGLEADVALKLMLPIQSAEAKELQLLERFEQEARVIRELEHPCALKVRDYGRTPEGLPYLVTEFVRGTPLDKVLAKEGTLSPSRVVRIATQVLGCLAEAHHRGIVHRDMKPSNIMLRDIFGETDAVKVLDFGIAKVAAGRGGVRTQTGQALGTPHYISPEQCKGGRDLDGRVDLYALGLIMAECLCGRRIVDPPDSLTAIYIHTSPLAHRFPAEVTKSPLLPVIQRATAKERTERYPDALAMRDAIEALGIPAPPRRSPSEAATAGEPGDAEPPVGLAPDTPIRSVIGEPAPSGPTRPLTESDGDSDAEDLSDTVRMPDTTGGAPSRGTLPVEGATTQRRYTPYAIWAGLLVLVALAGLLLLTYGPGREAKAPPAQAPPVAKPVEPALAPTPGDEQVSEPTLMGAVEGSGTGLGTGALGPGTGEGTGQSM